jgi:hypothetical protein
MKNITFWLLVDSTGKIFYTPKFLPRYILLKYGTESRSIEVEATLQVKASTTTVTFFAVMVYEV